MEVSYQLRHVFFDRPGIQRRVDQGRRKALSKAGSWVRRRARSILRRRKRVSRVGEPPSVHSDPGLKTILFGWDQGRQSVVVGPVRLNKVVMGTQTRVPSLMEFGGEVSIHEEARANGQPWSADIGMWRRRDMRRLPKPWKVYRVRRAHYGPRPFMAPALAQTVPTLPQGCRDLLSPTAQAYAA